MLYCIIAGFLSHSYSIDPDFQGIVNDCSSVFALVAINVQDHIPVWFISLAAPQYQGTVSNHSWHPWSRYSPLTLYSRLVIVIWGRSRSHHMYHGIGHMVGVTPFLWTFPIPTPSGHVYPIPRHTPTGHTLSLPLLVTYGGHH